MGGHVAFVTFRSVHKRLQRIPHLNPLPFAKGEADCSLTKLYSPGVLRHAIRLSPFGERMKVRGLFFGLAKSPFDA